jgi:putative Mg2+ transporter-C (MgtC) family protein
MRFIDSFNLLALANSAVCLGAAFLLGTLIGAERQYRQRSAGLRTNVLVALGAAAFVDLGMRTAGPASTQVMAYVVSGIGFLGAGAIMKEGVNIRGLNTAATLWCSAAVGAAAGSGLIVEATMLTVLVIAGNTLLRPLVNSINRIPIDEQTVPIRLTQTPAMASVCPSWRPWTSTSATIWLFPNRSLSFSNCFPMTRRALPILGAPVGLTALSARIAA